MRKLYCHLVVESSNLSEWCCASQAIARPMYSNPPLHGALLVSTILKDNELKQQWYKVSQQSHQRSFGRLDECPTTHQPTSSWTRVLLFRYLLFDPAGIQCDLACASAHLPAANTSVHCCSCFGAMHAMIVWIHHVHSSSQWRSSTLGHCMLLAESLHR